MSYLAPGKTHHWNQTAFVGHPDYGHHCIKCPCGYVARNCEAVREQASLHNYCHDVDDTQLFFKSL